MSLILAIQIVETGKSEISIWPAEFLSRIPDSPP